MYTPNATDIYDTSMSRIFQQQVWDTDSGGEHSLLGTSPLSLHDIKAHLDAQHEANLARLKEARAQGWSDLRLMLAARIVAAYMPAVYMPAAYMPAVGPTFDILLFGLVEDEDREHHMVSFEGTRRRGA